MKNILLLIILHLFFYGCTPKVKKLSEPNNSALSMSDQLISLAYDYMSLSSKMNDYSKEAHFAKSKKESILYLDSVLYIYENTCPKLDSIASKYFSILDSKKKVKKNSDEIKKAKDIMSLRKAISETYTDNHAFKLEIKRGEIKLDSWNQK